MIVQDYTDDADPDNDGLTNLQEYIAGTDPLTWDTDGDGFGDGTDTNPIVPEDFNIVEVDEDGNGIPDYFDGLGLYDFTPNAEGFDASYYNNDLLPLGGTFDVLVHIESTRSVVLTWTGGSAASGGGIVFPVAESEAGQVMAQRTVRLRFPFGVVSRVALSPHHGDASGVLSGPWKARMTAGFIQRPGITASGDYVSTGSVVVKRVPICESTIEFIDSDDNQGGGLLLRSAGSTTTELSTEFHPQDYEVMPDDEVWHDFLDSQTFTLETKTGEAPPEIEWSTTCNGFKKIHSTGTDTSIWLGASDSVSGESGDIRVTARLIFGPGVETERHTVWKYCDHSVFSLPDIPEFEPPGTYEIGAGCEHYEETLEIEVQRHTSSGWQHVAWFDMDSEREGHQQTVNLPTEARATWDGKVRTTVPQAEGAKVLSDFKKPLRRYLHRLNAGDYVTPGAYRIVARTRRVLYRDEYTVSYSDPWEETSKLVVPQVVQINWNDGAFAKLREPITYRLMNGTITNIYFGTNFTDAQLRSLTESRIKSFLPPGANFKIVSDDVVVNGVCKTVTLFSGDNGDVNGEGEMCKRNASVSATVSCWIGNFTGGINDLGSAYLKEKDEGKSPPLPFAIPVTFDYLHKNVCKVIAHEIGHTIGLVDDEYINAFNESDGFNKYHHENPTQNWMMNVGLIYMNEVFAFFDTAVWHEKSIEYAKLIIPSYGYDEED